MCASYTDEDAHWDPNVLPLNSLEDFEKMMEDPQVLDRCTHECMPNCQEVTYSYTMDTTSLDATKLCHDETYSREVIHLYLFLTLL